MNHPTITTVLAELDDTRTKLVDFVGNRPALTVDQRSAIKFMCDCINDAVLAAPHVQVPNG